MHDANVCDYRNATRRSPSDGFTAAVFSAVGLDRYATAASALGDVYVASSATGVSAVRPAGDESAFEDWYRERFGRRVVPAQEDGTIIAAARAKLKGELVEVPLDLRACSPFEQRVLRKTLEIRSNNARPYSWIAREIGTPSATRAVGNALGHNPVPLLVPCHRVVRSDFTVGGYVFGTDAKRALLAAEGLKLDAIEEVTRRGFRFVACDKGWFCMPTCDDVATRIDDPGYCGLHNAEEALRRGLRPCTSCRPIAA
jgi:O-6-methylguanine DNA methyltransferase